MAVVLPFQSPARPGRRLRRTASEPETFGQIVFFTGVRYERHLDSKHEPERPASGGGRRQRRRRGA